MIISEELFSSFLSFMSHGILGGGGERIRWDGMGVMAFNTTME